VAPAISVSCWESNGALLNFFAMIRLMRCGEQARSSAGCQIYLGLRSNGFDATRPSPVALPAYLSHVSEAQEAEAAMGTSNSRLENVAIGCFPPIKTVEGSSILAQGKLGAAF